MTEIEQIKQWLLAWNETYDLSIDMPLEEMNSRYVPFRENGIGWISSLITTIESQQEKLTEYSKLFLSLEASFLKFLSLTNINIATHPTVELQAEAVNQLLESQKEEIERLKGLKMPTITKFCDQETADKYYAEVDKPTPCKHGYRNLYCSQCAGEGER